MKTIKKFCAFIFIMSFLIESNAQQLPLLSQYMFNGFLVNPAVAGADGSTSINLTAREQWLGLANSPKTHIVSFQSRLLKNNFIMRNQSIFRRFIQKSRSGRVGIGGYLYNDKNGLIDRTGAQITYAYHLKMAKGQLSFGLSANIYQLSVDRSKLNLENTSDALIDNNDLKMYIPDFNFGVFYTAQQYYAGFSTAQLMQSSVQLSNDNSSQFRSYRQYSLTSGYNFDINRELSIVPSIYVKVTNQLVSQVDISTKVYFNDSYYAGISFRTGSALVITGGVSIKQYTFGYAFDYNLNAMRKHSYGSHEIMAAIKFGTDKRYKWINRF